MIIKGKIIVVIPKRSGVGKSGEWVNQSFVLETVGEYPERVVFEVFGADKINDANISVGDEVSIDFNFKAHEYNGKWFNSVSAWKVENETKKQNPEQAHAAQQRQQTSQTPPPTQSPISSDTSANDLPF